ncbi:TPA: carbohydrate porin [Vibrio parahaemolyticus]
MKQAVLKTTLLAAMVSSSLANAEIVNGTFEDIEFNGYFRMGGLFSVEDDLKKAKYPAQKETLGRLGIESDNWAEASLSKIFKTSSGKEIKIKSTFGSDVHRVQNQLSTSDDPMTVGFLENYVELKGATDSGTIWAGRRYYGKDNLIFMTDFFYTDYSGTGIGVQNYEVGDTKLEWAYLFSDRTDDNLSYFDGKNTNNMMHTLHASVALDKFEFDASVKHLPDNFDIDGKEWTDKGFDLMAAYLPDNYFGFGKGFSKVAFQAGRGLGSGQLLGGNFTNYNAYRPGRLATGANGQLNIAKVEAADMSYRALAYGGYFFDNGIQVFTSLQGQYNDLDNGRTEMWLSAMARPVVPLTDTFKVVSEIGYVNNSVDEAANDYWGDYEDNDTFKLSIAPTWTVDSGLGPAPELRLLATYLSDSGTNNGDSDIILGAQVDVWW